MSQQQPTTENTGSVTGRGSRGDKGETRRCKRCGEQVPRGRTVYCSVSCCEQRKGPQHRREAPCSHCGKTFLARVQRLEAGRPVYCSKECVDASAVTTGRFRGANNPRWLGGVSKDNMRYKRRTEARYPERAKARRMVNDALMSGRMSRRPCEVCGAAEAQAHHDDYSKPLEVRWLCRPHHDQHHTKERRAAASRPASSRPRREPGTFVWRGKVRKASVPL